MIKKIVTRKHLTTLVLGALLMASASPVWAADNYFGNFTDSSKGAAETTGKTIFGDVTYIMDETTLTPSGSEVDYTGMEVYSPNSDPVKVTVTGNYKTTIDNTKGQSTGLIVRRNSVVNLGSSDANEHTFSVTGTGEKVFGISLDGTDSNHEDNRLHVMGTTNITVIHDDTKEGRWTRGISDISSHESDTLPHNTIFDGPVGINVAGNNSNNTDGIYHEGNNTLTFNNDVGITVSSNQNVFGVSLSSEQSNVETKTNFNNKLTVTASGSSENVNGIYSGGSTGTLTAEFNGAVDVTSTKLGINNTYGTLNFRENADITAMKGIVLNSTRGNGIVSINFEKDLIINAVAGNTDNSDVCGIYSTGTDGTQESTFNGKVKIISEGKGIYHQYGTLNFNKDVEISAGRNGNMDKAAVYAESSVAGKTSNIEFNKGLIITQEYRTVGGGLWASDGGSINVNTDKDSEVQIKMLDDDAFAIYAMGGNITTYLTTGNSFIEGTIVGLKHNIAAIYSTGANDVIMGDLISRADGIVKVNINGKGTLTGGSYIIIDHPSDVNIIDVTLANGATWNVDGSHGTFIGDSTLTTLDLGANSTVNLSDKTINQKLTMENLVGKGGTFVLDIEGTKNVNNDKVYVTNDFTGTAKLMVVDVNGTSALTAGVKDTVLASTKGMGDFISAAAETPLHWLDYELSWKPSADSAYDRDWHISGVSGEASKKLTSTADTITSSAVGSYYLWRTDNDKLMQRLGDLRQSKNEDQGIWARITRDGTEYDHNAYFHNNTSTVQVGYDKVISRDTKDNYWVAGGAIGYINGSGSYHYGSSDNSAATFSLYGTRMGSKGHYLDLVAKVGKYNHHFDTYMMNGFQQKGDYDTFGYSVSAEYGRKTPLKSGWYVEPQMQLTLGHLNSADYVMATGLKVDQDSINSAIGRVGFNIGRNIGKNTNFYLKANVSHEFGGSGHVAMATKTDSRNEDLSLDDTWFTYGLGVSAPVNKDSYMYFDIERSTGSDFTTDWQWNAGMRFSI